MFLNIGTLENIKYTILFYTSPQNNHNDFNILKKKLTIYLKDEDGITSKYKKFNNMWWKKRYEAFCYLKYILNLKNKKFKKGLDYFITKIFHFFG